MNQEKYICFSLGAEEYAIPLLQLREVIAMPELTPIPKSPPHFLGLMNLRGQVISVLDLRTKAGIKGIGTSSATVILIDVATTVLGVVVDSVNSVLSPEPEDISESPLVQSQIGTKFITAVYRKANRIILFIDILKIMDLEDLKTIEESAA